MYWNKVEICGVNTSKLKTLTDEEKRELLLRMKAGDQGARDELIYGNLRLVAVKLGFLYRKNFLALKVNSADSLHGIGNCLLFDFKLVFVSDVSVSTSAAAGINLTVTFYTHF